jgi:glycosyltransferase involved in cell wall biosynthesis
MAAGLTIVIPVWDEHTRLLPRCLQAIRNEPIAADLILVDNASTLPFETPPRARHVTLTQRQSIGAARNAGLAHVNTPFVVFADADDEITPGSVAAACPFSNVGPTRRVSSAAASSKNTATADAASPHTPLFWLIAFQCSITSTVLRTATVLDADAFPDTNIAEDWHLAARLARRGPFICLNEAVRIYHRHPAAARNAYPHQGGRTVQATVCTDCLSDPNATATERLLAAILRRAGRSTQRRPGAPATNGDRPRDS